MRREESRITAKSLLDAGRGVVELTESKVGAGEHRRPGHVGTQAVARERIIQKKSVPAAGRNDPRLPQRPQSGRPAFHRSSASLARSASSLKGKKPNLVMLKPGSSSSIRATSFCASSIRSSRA